MGIADYIVSLGYHRDIHVVRTIQQGLSHSGDVVTQEYKLLIQYMLLMMFDD
jgi:hypothetical protein